MRSTDNAAPRWCKARMALRAAAFCLSASFALSLLGYALSADAAPGALDAHRIGAGSQSEVLPVVAYDGIDPRETEAQYAKSHNIALAKLQQSISAAVGETRCGEYVGTANLTLSSSVISTSGHILCDGKSTIETSKCMFTYLYENQKHVIPLTSAKEAPLDCANHVGNKDWAVIRLSSPAVGPNPLKIAPALSNSSYSGSKITSIAWSSVDFCARNASGNCLRSAKYRYNILPKTLVDCLIRGTASRADGSIKMYVTDCPGSGGTSGAALINRDLSGPVLLGLYTGTNATPEEHLSEKRAGRPINRAFSKEKNHEWFSVGVAVTGDFARAIERLAAESPVNANVSPLPEKGWRKKILDEALGRR